ncbi:DUF998 domain-containing protein [Nonomuraea rhodomycinica]|uniref:DUF998 domain-containing protein n=1 Tax=Nonomuraea rhodomycinica TaxID=1712872 RepID=A0A7Y6IYF3_9ACTN|nr:DUF998 domain-containing protein [Nonomuraea rhodomycinica]NUW46754.1 DUF998 domain-containing protein [Nonomuraea rhodomycinica]
MSEPLPADDMVTDAVAPGGVVAGAVTCAVAAAGALAYAEVTLPAQPLLSDYALVPGGTIPVLGGMLALAGACVLLAYGLAARAPSRSAATRVLLVAAAGGLMLGAVFPTDPSAAEISSMAGEIHRWASAVVFTALPVAGWVLARDASAPRRAHRSGSALGDAGPRLSVAPRWNVVRAVSVTSALALAAFLAAHPASFLSPLIGGDAYYGLLERALALSEISLVALMALASARRGRPAVTCASSSPAAPPLPRVPEPRREQRDGRGNVAA